MIAGGLLALAGLLTATVAGGGTERRCCRGRSVVTVGKAADIVAFNDVQYIQLVSEIHFIITFSYYLRLFIRHRYTYHDI